ncbi:MULTISPECIES: hypothetical protein [Sphingobacterium]|uniref:hypothetical protein n=1 Tax=Sphingobacterium TaxID=28453 RepID=UPI0013DB7799|nr:MULTISPECIES: hypothetical protein [unclassified Sphingobacterium]
MKSETKKAKKGSRGSSKSERKEIIKNHKEAAFHFKAAAKSHLKAAKHQKNGSLDKALKSALEAKGHSSIGKEVQKNAALHMHRA